MADLGKVTLRDFDRGVVRVLEAVTASYVVDGGTRNAFVLQVPGVMGPEDLSGAVPVYVKVPEDRFQEHVVPSVTIVRNSLDPAFSRSPWFGTVRRDPAPGAQQVDIQVGWSNGQPVVVSGFTKYVEQWKAHPFDMSYDVHLRARVRSEHNALLLYVLRRMTPPWFTVPVEDSVGVLRGYDAGDVSVSDTSSLQDVGNREVSSTISFTLQGELDLVDAYEKVALSELPAYTVTTI